METSYRKRLIRIVTFLGGIYFFLEFILPKVALESLGIADLHTEISNGFIAFGTVAVGLGIINLLLVHGSRVVYVRKNWSYSFILLIGLFSMMTVAALDWVEGYRLTGTAAQYSHLADFANVITKDHTENRTDVLSYQERTVFLVDATEAALAKLPEYYQGDITDENDHLLFQSYVDALKGYQEGVAAKLTELNPAPEVFQAEPYTTLAHELSKVRAEFQKLLFLKQKYSLMKKLYDFLYEGLFVALGSAMFSLLAMYIAAAAYRAFRIKTLESGLMMAAAVVVMLGQIPFYAYISSDLPFIRSWLLEVPNSAAFRAIKIGASIAGLVMAFRMWFSIESDSFSRKEES